MARLAAGAPGSGFAVRSSAVWEDGDFSFAGQYSSCLNVPAAEVERRYKDVVGSLFTPRAIFYYRTKGFAEEEMAMAVGVMRMVDARAAGVIYTRDPLDPEREVMVINGVWGLGTTVVDGTVHADALVVDRATGAASSAARAKADARGRRRRRRHPSARRWRRASAARPASPTPRPPNWCATARSSRRASADRRTSSGRSTAQEASGSCSRGRCS